MKKIFTLATLVATLMLTGCSTKEQPQQVADQNAEASFSEVLMSRRSIRNFDASQTISEEEIRTLLTETQEAPSWANQQPTKYYVALSDEKVEAVRDLIGFNKERTAGAHVFIVSTFERGKSGFFRGEQTNEVGDGWGAYDNGLSNAYLILAARAKGFDTLIMGMRDSDGLRTLFNIPEEETVMAVIALGYRAEEPTQPEHRNFDEVVSFF